jgi:hypothetical protein
MALSRIIVEHTYDPPMTDEQHHAASKRLDPCLAAHGATWVRTYLSADKRRMVCEFEAPDAEAVRVSFNNADVKFERAWTAEVWER